MSRLGKKPLSIATGITVALDGLKLEIKGALGKLQRRLPEGVSVAIDDAARTVTCSTANGKDMHLLGTTRAVIRNMLAGVTLGFSKSLELSGVGYRAQVEQDTLVLQLGFSHLCRFKIPQDVKVRVDKQTVIIIEGIDKEVVGRVAASIRALKTPEPYKATGIKYAGEHIVRKAGKTGAGAGAAAGGKK